MRLKGIVFAVFAFVLLSANAFFESSGRALADYPNPNIDPIACGRFDVPRSSICDPDKLLTNDDKNIVEGYINKIAKAQVAVAVTNKMSMRGLSTTDISTASERYARGLHDKWGVGDAQLQNGILIFLAISDRSVYISTGSGVQNTLTYSNIQALIQQMKPLLRQQKYGTALSNCLIQIDLLLSGKTGSIIQSAYSSNSNYNDSGEGYAETAIAVVLFAGMLLVGIFLKRRDNFRLQSYQRGRQMINNLMTAVDTDGKGEQQPKYLSSSCPICLEDFPKKEETDKKDDDVSASTDTHQDCAKAPMALQCGHVFCKGCLETFLNSVEGNNCPICRAPVDHNQGGAGANGGGATTRTTRTRGWRGLFPFSSSNVRTLDTNSLRHDYNSYWASRSYGSSSTTATQTMMDPMQHDTFYRHTPEIRFRLHRMRSLYPDIMSLELLRSMNSALDRGAVYDFRNQLDLRSMELHRLVEDIRKASEMSARNSGMRGSSHSFGGGGSSGGGGGRW